MWWGYTSLPRLWDISRLECVLHILCVLGGKHSSSLGIQMGLSPQFIQPSECSVVQVSHNNVLQLNNIMYCNLVKVQWYRLVIMYRNIVNVQWGRSVELQDIIVRGLAKFRDCTPIFVHQIIGRKLKTPHVPYCPYLNFLWKINTPTHLVKILLWSPPL